MSPSALVRWRWYAWRSSHLCRGSERSSEGISCWKNPLRARRCKASGRNGDRNGASPLQPDRSAARFCIRVSSAVDSHLPRGTLSLCRFPLVGRVRPASAPRLPCSASLPGRPVRADRPSCRSVRRAVGLCQRQRPGRLSRRDPGVGIALVEEFQFSLQLHMWTSPGMNSPHM